jgi:hypothetical protein
MTTCGARACGGLGGGQVDHAHFFGGVLACWSDRSLQMRGC